MGIMNYNIENETHIQLNPALDNLVFNLAWIISANYRVAAFQQIKIYKTSKI